MEGTHLSHGSGIATGDGFTDTLRKGYSDRIRESGDSNPASAALGRPPHPGRIPPQANQTPSESQARLFTFHRTRQNRLSSNQAAELLSFVTVNFPVRHPEALPQPHRATHRGLRPEGGRAPFLLLLQCLTAAVALGQVRISEFLASNAQSHPDIVDFTDYPDWIELENTTDQPVSLGGWYLSDDPARPLRWAFPSTAVIPAHGFLLVWADGKDAIPGQTHPRGYWPWRSFVTEGYHANFSLSATGESIVLSRSGNALVSVLITPGTPKPLPPLEAARWRYLDDGSNPGTTWRSRTFDDTGWKSGPSPLGYGDGDEATEVGSGPSANNRFITTYFRHTFTIENPQQITALNLQLLVDDGAVVYLNGEEVVRQNLPSGEVTHQTLAGTAIGGAAENQFTAHTIPNTALVAGINVIAVEVHQSAANSSDISFDLSLVASTAAEATVVDQTPYGLQIQDISRGRDSSGDWVQFMEPTPMAPNTSPKVLSLRTEGPPVTIRPDGGRKSSATEVTLEAASGTIRYTLDGSNPRSDSPRYEGPLNLTNTTVVRARAFAEGIQPGPIVTRTYMIGEPESTLPTISVVSDPQRLFGDRIGIYYNQHEAASGGGPGLRDVYKGKDAPGHLEFFPVDGGAGFRANGGFRMGGENNWVHAQRALNFALRSAYGDTEIRHDLFPGSGIALHQSLTLRDGGDAWDREMLRDALWAFLAKGQMQAGTSDYRPSIVYINGAYWGIHDIRARWDDMWFFEHFRLNAGDVDHLIYGHMTSSSVTLGAEKGDTTSWLALLDYLRTHDLNDPAVWAAAEAEIDIDSFIDFVVSESYGVNTSWRHNREFWRSRAAGGRWRWFLPDMDQTFRLSQVGGGVLSSMLQQEDLLMLLKNSTVFRKRLAQRFAAHLGSTFQPSRVIGLLDGMAAEVEAEIPRHSARWAPWGGLTPSSRANALADMRTFIQRRREDDGALAEIRQQLGLPGAAVAVTLGTSPSQGGQFRIQGVPVDPGSLRLFPGIPVEIQAVAAPGHRFVRWTGRDGGALQTLTLTDAAELVAEFEPAPGITLGGMLDQDRHLTAEDSPCFVDSDLIIPKGRTLTVGPGVVFEMQPGRHLRVQGALQIEGTADKPVRFLGREGAHWGGISFETPEVASTLRHVVLRGATRGFNPAVYPYAISGLNAQLTLDSLDIDDCEGPIFCRGGFVTLRNSRLRTPYTGDCINVKQGGALTENCTFFGNNAPDTDAIDYDGVTGGIIRNCKIYRFAGPNCDGIDIGEECKDVLLEDNRIYFNSDKGVSVGQGSSVILRHNLVVGCNLGVGVKDLGSRVILDQNTLVRCTVGVDVYEKNFGHGGGQATVVNTLFSKCSVAAIRADALSKVDAIYCLSDTLPIPGVGNLLADPRFVDPGILNFQIQPDSPAVDAGDPSHEPDADGSRADIGARYQYQLGDYPYAPEQRVVIDEVLANSGAGADWIELLNRSSVPVDISGWYLSDSGTVRQKYRIPLGTHLQPGGRIVFREDLHFGDASTDPGRLVPFALSDLGETLHLTAFATSGQIEYDTKEDFGASLPGEAQGNHYRSSTDSWNFVPLLVPTPGDPNSPPRIGPVVISEIHYAPASDPETEFLELVNVSPSPVTLFDADRKAAWRISDGVEFEFPTNTPVVLQPQGRLVLVANLDHFKAAFQVPEGVPVFAWTSGRLSNGGETVQLDRPAGLDELGVRHYGRVDRVNYLSQAPWTPGALLTGKSLQKSNEAAYGNDPAPWSASAPTPGYPIVGSGFPGWIFGFGLPSGLQGPDADADEDGLPNLLEFALGRIPDSRETEPVLAIDPTTDGVVVRFRIRSDRSSLVAVRLESSGALAGTEWQRLAPAVVATEGSLQTLAVRLPAGVTEAYFRLVAE